LEIENIYDRYKETAPWRSSTAQMALKVCQLSVLAADSAQNDRSWGGRDIPISAPSKIEPALQPSR
jgi:hypothetical protein